MNLEPFTKETNPLIWTMYYHTDPAVSSNGLLFRPMYAQEADQRAKVVEVIRLLDSGSNPNETHGGKSAIYCAIMIGLYELVDRFLDAGVDVTHAADMKSSVIDAMTTRHSSNTMEEQILIEGPLLQRLLLAGTDIYMRDAEGNTFLHHAQHHVNPAMMKLLLDAGLDINAKNNEGRTVLHNCIHNWRMETVNVILAASPDMNARDNAGNTALYYAIKGSKFTPDSTFESQATLDVIRRLIEANAATDFVDSEGNSLLHLAMHWGYNNMPYLSFHQSMQIRPDLTALLIERGLDVNARNHLGQTPLMLAVQACDVDSIRHLCAVPGIDRAARDILRNSAMYYAQQGLRLIREFEERPIDQVPLLPPISRSVAGGNNIPFVATPDDYAQIIELLTA